MIADYVLTYLGIGVFLSIIMDISIRQVKTSEPLTFIEILTCIFTWPVVIFILIKGFIEGDY